MGIRNNTNRIKKHFRNNAHSDYKQTLVSIAIFAVVGTLILSFSRAASPTVSIEAENNLASLSSCANRISNDVTASGGGAVKFGCSGGNALGLDNSGKTIPQTNYSIPAGAIYMSPAGGDKNSNSVDGNDANDGTTKDKPVRTINRAVALATGSRTTIIMRGGEYRDWYTGSSSIPGTINKSLTIQAYPAESPWFNGTDIVNDNWASDGSGHWSRTWETPTFCGGQYYTSSNGLPPYTPQRRADGTKDPLVVETNCMYEDAANDPAYPMAGNPQQAFINNERQLEVASLNQVVPGKFYYNWSTRQIYIGTDPSGKTIELSARPAAFILTGADTDSHALKGIGFKRYATNGGERTSTGGVVYLTRKTLIENSVFSENSTNGFSLSSPKNGTVIRSSVVAFNGGTGMSANGSSKTPGARNDFVIDGNVFNSNNWERGGLYCNRACGPSGIKLAHMVGFTTKNNVFENNFSRAPGFWCDLDCSDMITVNNIVRNNGGEGIFYEVSNKGIIANNLVYNNGGPGINIASANIKVYNNTVVDKYGPYVEGIRIYDDQRTPPSATAVWPWYNSAHDNGPNTSNIELVNNLIVGPDDKNGARLVIITNGSDIGPLNFTADKYMSVFNYNAYYRLNTGQNLYYYIATDAYKYVTDMQNISANKYEMNSFSVEVVSPFVSRSGLDFRIKTDSLAFTNKGAPLPADVAAALGLPAGSVHNRGAITLP